MERDYIALAAPVFMLLIGLELWVVRRHRADYYRLSDSLDNIATGILQQWVSILGAAWIVGVYFWIHQHGRIFELSSESVWVWVVCFVAVDFAYYWYHRLAHEVNFLWASHIAHHQSEEYNLSVALRQGAFQPLFSCVFYWPIALLGFPPVIFTACLAFDTLYQFWIHTRTIDRLGPFEAVFMTPSHHRVHHGRNPIYIDRNHGGCFILWDKLFGTFEPESEEVVFGITTQLGSWNPVWANFHYWIEIGSAALRARRLRDKFLMFVKPPGWYPEDLGGFRPAPALERPTTKFDPPLPRNLAVYCTLQFVQVLVLSSAIPALADELDTAALWLAAGLVTWSLLNIGVLADGRRWAVGSEFVRVVATPILCTQLLPAIGIWIPIALALNIVPLVRGVLRPRAERLSAG